MVWWRDGADCGRGGVQVVVYCNGRRCWRVVKMKVVGVVRGEPWWCGSDSSDSGCSSVRGDAWNGDGSG